MRHVWCLYVCVGRMNDVVRYWIRVLGSCKMPADPSSQHTHRLQHSVPYLDVKFLSNDCLDICTVATGFLYYMLRREEQNLSGLYDFSGFSQKLKPVVPRLDRHEYEPLSALGNNLIRLCPQWRCIRTWDGLKRIQRPAGIRPRTSLERYDNTAGTSPSTWLSPARPISSLEM